MTLLHELRAITPPRRLTYQEALTLAERQATTLLRRLSVSDGPVPTEALSGLPFLLVSRATPMRSSGATKWVKPRWIVLLNGSEPPVRQRFSLAHELKHILDHPRRAVDAGGALHPDQRRQAELVCDYFAACLLMPRPWVKRAYTHGVQRLAGLADYFDVSQAAMALRLTQLGLLEDRQRCDSQRPLYFRQAPLLLPGGQT